ncbi:TonB family protein [Methyloferula stellata]|uniref:TonB family protein n=1 Tax=Methyloferula stellata TaxID=876270 RepID=UPI0031379F45
MIEQTPVKQQDFQEQKPVEKPEEEAKEQPKPLDEAKLDMPPPGPLSLDAKAVGPGDSFGLGGKPGGHGLIGGGGGGGSRWGWYASIVQSQVETALHANPRTRSAVMQMKVRLWADPSGRISRVQIDSSSGNPEVDAAIRNEVLAGLILHEPPPKEMPMPIVMRITSRKPS